MTPLGPPGPRRKPLTPWRVRREVVQRDVIRLWFSREYAPFDHEKRLAGRCLLTIPGGLLLLDDDYARDIEEMGLNERDRRAHQKFTVWIPNFELKA